MPELDIFRPGTGEPPSRDAVPEKYRWDLSAICGGWDAWRELYERLEARIEEFKRFEGTLASGPAQVLAAFKAMDEMGALAYRVWYYAALQYDEDQRLNDINARRQQVQILFAKQHQASSWFNPELLAIPIETVRGWLAEHGDLAVYRFAIENLFHEQEHVLDQEGERLLSYAGRFNSVPNDRPGRLLQSGCACLSPSVGAILGRPGWMGTAHRNA
jgi:oligoendopeptidase F